jgi:putative phosphoribosyl transferase
MPRPFASEIPFIDRREAGRELARHLTDYHQRSDVVVLALPRGGVPVAYEVATALDAPLDVFVVRKVGLPGHREFAIGALATGGVLILDEELLRTYRIPRDAIDAVVREEQQELERRERAYRAGEQGVSVAGRVVILVDDGLATGSTMKAAVRAVRQLGPSRVVVAAPVGAADSCRELESVADAVVCARTPQPFRAVGLWYHRFDQTSDDEVMALLSASRAPAGKAS